MHTEPESAKFDEPFLVRAKQVDMSDEELKRDRQDR